VVTAETATTMGYKKSLVTFSDIPSVAMIKENSQFVPMSFLFGSIALGLLEIKAPIIELID
jgi:hypothetical protein